MEAVLARLLPEDDPQTCSIEACSGEAIYRLIKFADDRPEKERFFCEEHGNEYAGRAHLVISPTT